VKMRMQDNNLISVKTYDYCAAVYEQRFMDTSPYQARVDEFCNHLTSSRSKIVDLGCGPGNYSKYIFENKGFKNIHGVDLSEEMIKRAKKNVPSASFQVSDVRKLALPINSYHGVFSSFCIPYLSYHETEKLIVDVVNILKSSGIFYVSCMEGTKSGFEQTSFSGEMPVFIYYYTEEFLVGTMEERGFQILSVNRQPYLEKDGIFSTDLIIIAQKA